MVEVIIQQNFPNFAFYTVNGRMFLSSIFSLREEVSFVGDFPLPHVFK